MWIKGKEAILKSSKKEKEIGERIMEINVAKNTTSNTLTVISEKEYPAHF